MSYNSIVASKIIKMPPHSVMIAVTSTQRRARLWFNRVIDQLTEGRYSYIIDPLRHTIKLHNGAIVRFMSTDSYKFPPNRQLWSIRAMEYDFVESWAADFAPGDWEFLKSRIRGRRPDGTQRGEW